MRRAPLADPVLTRPRRLPNPVFARSVVEGTTDRANTQGAVGLLATTVTSGGSTTGSSPGSTPVRDARYSATGPDPAPACDSPHAWPTTSAKATLTSPPPAPTSTHFHPSRKPRRSRAVANGRRYTSLRRPSSITDETLGVYDRRS